MFSALTLTGSMSHHVPLDQLVVFFLRGDHGFGFGLDPLHAYVSWRESCGESTFERGNDWEPQK